MKRIILATFALSLLTAGLFLISNHNDTHSEYEDYLLTEWSSLDSDLIRNPDAIPKLDRPDMAAIQDYYEILDPEEKRIPTERLRQGRQQAFAAAEQEIFTANHHGVAKYLFDMGGRTTHINVGP
ncbi:MAG: hypothetical protein U5L09_07445 [Bacteroidales bacterium]|nr:hypothetical protein [Bacteroidales bacterium]